MGAQEALQLLVGGEPQGQEPMNSASPAAIVAASISVAIGAVSALIAAIAPSPK